MKAPLPHPAGAATDARLLVLNRSQVSRLLDLDALFGALEQAFIELSAGRASVPPRSAAQVPNGGWLGVMPGYLRGVLEVKLVSVFPRNHDRGLPSHQALIALFDEETGTPVAVMDGTHITTVRTGAASAVATRALARRKVRTLAILGAGVQGRSHLQAVTRVRDFAEIRIASRTAAHASALAVEHPRARAVASFEEAVRGADVVCACTDSATPVLRYEWLTSGAHISSVGAARGGPELDARTVQAGRLVVESRVAFQAHPAGAHELAGMDPSRAAELGEILAGGVPGRQSDEEITVYKSIGHAVEDAAAARMVYDRAIREGAGESVRL